LADVGRLTEAADQITVIGASTAELLLSDAADLGGLRGRFAAARGHTHEAIDLAERAIADAAATDSPLVQAVAALDQAITLQQLGLLDQATAAATVACQRFQDKGHRPGVRRAEAFRARLANHRDVTRARKD
jgi:hypothetical protein